jgi:hypothetical protein
MPPRAPDRLATLRQLRARCLLAARRGAKRARKEAWDQARLRDALQRARLTCLAYGASNKQWYAAVRRIFGTGALEASVVDRRQLALPFAPDEPPP